MASFRSFPVEPAPIPSPEKKEGMVAKLVLILHSSAVDLGSHPARVNKRGGSDGQPLAPVADFGRGSSRRRALTPLGVTLSSCSMPAQAFFERAGHSGGNTAECQSNPRTQPNAWNQNGSDRRRSSSSERRSATM